MIGEKKKADTIPRHSFEPQVAPLTESLSKIPLQEGGSIMASPRCYDFVKDSVADKEGGSIMASPRCYEPRPAGRKDKDIRVSALLERRQRRLGEAAVESPSQRRVIELEDAGASAAAELRAAATERAELQAQVERLTQAVTAEEEAASGAIRELCQSVKILSDVLFTALQLAGKREEEWQRRSKIWENERLQFLCRVSEMEQEGEECIVHFEEEIDRLLQKVEKTQTPLSRASSVVRTVHSSGGLVGALFGENQRGSRASHKEVVQRKLMMEDSELQCMLRTQAQEVRLDRPAITEPDYMTGTQSPATPSDHGDTCVMSPKPVHFDGSDALASQGCSEVLKSGLSEASGDLLADVDLRVIAQVAGMKNSEDAGTACTLNVKMQQMELEAQRLREELAVMVNERDSALQQASNAFETLKQIRAGKIGAKTATILRADEGKAQADGTRLPDADIESALRAEIRVLRGKVKRRDEKIEKLVLSEQHLREAVATVGSSAAMIRADLHRDSDALRAQNKELKRKMAALQRFRYAGTENSSPQASHAVLTMQKAEKS